jgi:radical SAM protein with 4Fe4S-binding SPASM domain
VKETIEQEGSWEPQGYRDEGWFCGAGISGFNIDPYGEVQPCIAMRMPCGNLREQRFEEIWETAAPFKRLRGLKIADVYGCASCPVRDYCEACPGLFFMEMGDVTIPSPHTCEMAEMKHQAATGVFKPAGSRDADGNLPRPNNVIVGSMNEPLVMKARLSDA